MKRPNPGVCIVLIMLVTVTIAVPFKACGSTGLAFLQIGAGGRAVALGDAVVSQVDDASAVYWNPAALGLMHGTWAEVAHNEIMQGIRYEFVSVTRRLGRHGVGLAWHGLWTDPLRGFDDKGEYQGEFGYYDMAFSGSYAFALSEKVGVGATVEYLREVIDVFTASGTALGFGLQARDLFRGTSLGFSVRHLGSSMKFERQSFDLPLTLQGGVSHRIPLGFLNGGLLLAVEGQKVRDQNTHLLLGTEYQYQDLIRLQFGYRSGLDTQTISMGLGVGGKGLRGDYAFVPYGENLGNEHRVSLSYNF